MLVEKLVELGVSRFVPLQTRYSVAQPSSAALVRLERVVIEASKQCGRNRLMEISAAQDKAAAQLRQESVDTAINLAGKLIQQNLDSDQNRELTNKLMHKPTLEMRRALQDEDEERIQLLKSLLTPDN